MLLILTARVHVSKVIDIYVQLMRSVAVGINRQTKDGERLSFLRS